MSDLLSQLGISWKLFLSQVVNFLLLIFVLKFLLYKPLIKLLKERREKIEIGIKGGLEAEKIISQAEKIKEQKISEAEIKALSIIKKAENDAAKTRNRLLAEAKSQSDALLKENSEVIERRRIEELHNLIVEAKELVKKAIIKTVQLDPKDIDEKLVESAIQAIIKEIK